MKPRLKIAVKITFLLFLVWEFLPAQPNDDLDGLKLNPKITPLNYLIGNFDPEKAKEFSKVDRKHAKRVIYLRKEVLEAFYRMSKQAEREGIKLRIISGFRSFDHQKKIWNRKYRHFTPVYLKVQDRVKEILKYSSLPGTSRHHWGTDIDINSLDNRYFIRHKYGKKVHSWLSKNANRFGFYLTYSPDHRRTGYKTEYWHYTYYPSASKFTHYFFLYVNPNSVTIFKEQNNLNLKDIFKEYVLGIDGLILKKMRLDGILIEVD